MTDIILSSGVRGNLLSLQNTAKLLERTQERLATGLKVNSALDDPTAFFTSASLNNRAADLTRLLDSISLGVQTLEAADVGIKGITDLLETAQASARQALQAPGPATPAIAATIVGSVDLGVDVAAIITGDVDLSGDAAVAAATGTLTIAVAGGATANIDFGALTTNAGLDTALAAAATTTGLTIAVNGVSGFIDITAGDNTTSFTTSGTASGAGANSGVAAATVDPTNATIDALTGTTTITIGSNSALSLDFDAAIANRAQLTTALGTLAGGTAAIGTGNLLTVTATSDSDSIVTVGAASAGLGLGAAGTTAPTTGTAVDNVIRTKAEADYNALLIQVTELARDASFNGNNLLQSDNLKIFFNENSTSSLTINGVDFDAIGLGLTSVAPGSFQDNTNINLALNELETAILQIRTQAGTFGSNLSVVETRQQFTSALINTLETGGANLVLADINEEGANLLALQTRQQLSSTALSLASQADQNVLRLFG